MFFVKWCCIDAIIGRPPEAQIEVPEALLTQLSEGEFPEIDFPGVLPRNSLLLAA